MALLRGARRAAGDPARGGSPGEPAVAAPDAVVPGACARCPPAGRRWRVARPAVLVAFVAALAWITVPAADRPRPAAWTTFSEPVGAPPLALAGVGGRRAALADWRGKVVVLNFWATWCAPCVAEMPFLARFRQRFANAGVEVVAVNLMEGEPRIRDFLRATPVDLPILLDTDGVVAGAWGVSFLPVTFVLDAQGRVRARATGAVDDDAATLVATVCRALREAPPPGGLPADCAAPGKSGR